MQATADKQSYFPAASSIGPQCLVFNPAGMPALPATIVASGTYDSGVIIAAGWKAIAAACTLSQAGTVTIQRYLDEAGTIKVGALVSATLVADTAQWATVNDGVPFSSFRVVITNSGIVTGNLTLAGILLGAS